MKKLLFGLIATVAIAFSSNAQDIKASKSIDLGFGKVSSYAGPCENASGFCSTKSTVPFNTNTAYAGISKTADGRVVIQMNEAYYRNISPALVNGTFVVDYEYSLPKDVLGPIGINTTYTVKPGVHKVNNIDGIYTINL